MTALILIAAALLAGGPQARSADARDDGLEARTTALAAQLRCPVCQGTSIQDSPSELAQQMRAVVRQRLEEGRTPDEVKQYFVDKYGEWILLAPEPRGFNLVAYLLPPILLFAAAFLLYRLMRRWVVSPREA